MGEADGSMVVFSFWPDVIMLKEVGDPLVLADYLGLDHEDFQARVILAQGRQNTNYAIDIYACHPFFIQGYATMTNGENTAFVPIREYLTSRGYPGYVGYQSDSEVFTTSSILPTSNSAWGWRCTSTLLTPLKDGELDRHHDGRRLRAVKHACRPLTIDGPNCVIGCLPDRTLFMVQDSKKLRPGVVGGAAGMFAFSSEMGGLDAAIPARNKSEDFQPMKYDTVMVPPNRQEIVRWNQWER
jgi:glutamate synthase domain-containing protein 1